LVPFERSSHEARIDLVKNTQVRLFSWDQLWLAAESGFEMDLAIGSVYQGNVSGWHRPAVKNNTIQVRCLFTYSRLDRTHLACFNVWVVKTEAMAQFSFV